jgi:hypothetical protein
MGTGGGACGLAATAAAGPHLEHLQRAVDEMHLEVQVGGALRRLVHCVKQRPPQVNLVAIVLLAQV